MPTLPLFDRTASPGDWHGVAAPGGYEAWSFDAEDPSTDTQVTAVFTTGAQQRMAYLRQYAAYRRSPTTTQPPVPLDHAGVLVCVYRVGKLLRRAFTPGPVKLADAKLDVTIGAGRLWRTSESWKLAADGVELVLTPTLPTTPATQVLKFLSRRHEWCPVVPRGNVTGSIDGAGFSGAGSVEHAFGEGPVCFGLGRLIRGRVFIGDASAVFHIAMPQVARRSHGVTLLEANAAGVTELHEAAIEGPYADKIWFGDRLTLTQPRVIASHAHAMRIAYDADLQGVRGVAHCDVFYPQPPRRTFKKVVTDWLSGAE